MVLGLVGVPHDEITADYHASAGATAAFVDWLTVEHPEYMDAMTSQPPEYLQAPAEAMHGFLTEGDSRYGSLEGLAATLGLSPVTIDQLRHTPLYKRAGQRRPSVPSATRAANPSRASGERRVAQGWGRTSTT